MKYTIKLDSGGQQFSCSENEPVLTAALRADVALPHSCKEGKCGSCMGQVIEGDFVYPDGLPMAISQQFADLGFALFCSAHPRSDMIIKTSF